ncbi:hypothetical protein F3Y22_tig00111192pilonHSYRG00006 [Hibiscus syriacus]|uniref:DUF4283 domain-containing protein n=1 Tax=Hibiscus syriacus TaxID=106335 RepID=A0A6A2YWA2_HIBSY|nr:hypothetical protein F3Y22_tig00111192pilonHSYRG00006 [Hibiscus syriacus]
MLKDLLKGSCRWNDEERGMIALENFQDWMDGKVVLEEGDEVRYRDWEWSGSMKVMGKLATDKVLGRSSVPEISVSSDKEFEEDDWSQAPKNSWGVVGVTRGCHMISTAWGKDTLSLTSIEVECSAGSRLSTRDGTGIFNVLLGADSGCNWQGASSRVILLDADSRWDWQGARMGWKARDRPGRGSGKLRLLHLCGVGKGCKRRRSHRSGYCQEGKAIIRVWDKRLRGENRKRYPIDKIVPRVGKCCKWVKSHRVSHSSVGGVACCDRGKRLSEGRKCWFSHIVKRNHSNFVFIFRSGTSIALAIKKEWKSVLLLSSSITHLSSIMSEEVADLMKHLKFTEEESEDISPPRVITEDDVTEMNKWIIARIIGYQRIDSEVVLRVFRLIWGHARLLDSCILKDNMFLFKFKTLSDKQAILKRTPWSFEETLLAIAHFDPNLSLEEFDFRPLGVWVRIFELPLGYMKVEIAEKIENRIGNIIATDTRSGEGRMGDYLHVRVEIDCSKPLRRCAKMGVLANGEPRKCLLKYERLPSFYHRCGIIGHVLTECPGFSEQLQQPLQFGEWLRVSPIKNPVESSTIRREGIIYAEGETIGKSLTSSTNSPLSDRGTRSPLGRPWMPGYDLLHSTSSNREDDSNPTDPTGPDSSLPSRKRKNGETSKGKRKIKRVNCQVVHISDSTLNSKVGTSEEEDPSEIPEECAGDIILMAMAEAHPRQEP